MEFEYLEERTGWEVRRVAFAFGVEKWENQEYYSTGELLLEALLQGERFLCYISTDSKAYIFDLDFTTKCKVIPSRVQESSGEWHAFLNDQTSEIMVRGLFRMGLADESILAQLPPLSAHEKLELRHSMPREFWPRKWLEEEGE